MAQMLDHTQPVTGDMQSGKSWCAQALFLDLHQIHQPREVI
jgi:hypothetical protein